MSADDSQTPPTFLITNSKGTLPQAHALLARSLGARKYLRPFALWLCCPALDSLPQLAPPVAQSLVQTIPLQGLLSFLAGRNGCRPLNRPQIEPLASHLLPDPDHGQSSRGHPLAAGRLGASFVPHRPRGRDNCNMGTTCRWTQKI